MIRLTCAFLAVLLASQAAGQSIPPPAGQVHGGHTAGDSTVLRPADVARLAAVERAKVEAAASVRGTLSDEEYRALQDRLNRKAPWHDATALVGDWSCATTKIGQYGLVQYDAFRCRVTRQDDGGLLFEKLTGSQRVRGPLIAHESGIDLAGVGYIAGDTPPDYADLPEDIDTTSLPQRTADPGIVEMFGQDHARILFPYPQLESTLDILELTRVVP